MSDNQPYQPKKSKGQLPDYYASQEINAGKRTQLMSIGPMWESESGYISGPTVHGRIILQPRAAREALQEMREQNQQAQSQEQVQTQSQAPDISQ